jgi:hypothetical protein
MIDASVGRGILLFAIIVYNIFEVDNTLLFNVEKPSAFKVKTEIYYHYIIRIYEKINENYILKPLRSVYLLYESKHLILMLMLQ